MKSRRALRMLVVVGLEAESFVEDVDMRAMGLELCPADNEGGADIYDVEDLFRYVVSIESEREKDSMRYAPLISGSGSKVLRTSQLY